MPFNNIEIYTLYLGVKKDKLSKHDPNIIVSLHNDGAVISYAWRDLPRFPNAFEAWDIYPEDIGDKDSWHGNFKYYDFIFINYFTNKKDLQEDTYQWLLLLESARTSQTTISSIDDLHAFSKIKAFL